MSRLIFPEWTETLKKAIGVLVIGAPVYLALLIVLGVRDGKAIRIGYTPDQPVPYSHARHAGELGIDCRYCHTAADKSAKAAIPSANICMNCHTQVLPDDPRLLPVRQAYADNTPVRWIRVYDLPDYVYFNHSAHVTRGVGCESCHGRVDTMVKVSKEVPLTMGWCLDCHRNPEPHLRDPRDVTVMGYDPGKHPGKAAEVKATRNINPPTDCSTCHR
jgi:menaquinone reductase, multiheme cytochrome c subunit